METNIDETTDDEFGAAEIYSDTLQLTLLDDVSEIDGDCNESQPCRGDEPSLTQDIE